MIAVLLGLSILTTLVAAGMLAVLTISQRRVINLDDRELEATAATRDWPSVTMVVAARNEAEAIEPALISLLTLDYPKVSVVVVNDRSTDATGDILARVAQHYSQLVVKTVTQLPPFWLGKNHALWVGAQDVTSEFICFTDADVVFKPDALMRAMDYALATQCDHLAVCPRLESPSLPLLIVYNAFGIGFSFYSRYWDAPNPKSKAHIGVGACNLMKTSVYHAIGTHKALPMFTDDDMRLGQRIKWMGYQQAVAMAGDTIRVLWYPSIAAMYQGLMKNAFPGVGFSVWAVAGSTLFILVLNVLPLLLIPLSSGWEKLLFSLTVVLLMALSWANRRLLKLDQLEAIIVSVCYPVTPVFLAVVQIGSMIKILREGGVVWRDTFYPLPELRKQMVSWQASLRWTPR